MPRKPQASSFEEQPGDKFYHWKGVAPPKRTAHLTSEEVDEALANNLKDHVCDWKQNGSEIYCDAGDFVHGQRIGVDKRLAGQTKDGKPIFAPIGPVLRDSVKSG